MGSRDFFPGISRTKREWSMTIFDLHLAVVAQFLGLGVSVYGLFYGAGWLVRVFRVFAEDE